MIVALVDEAVRTGARRRKACEILGLNVRTLERWRALAGGEDRRAGPHSAPPNRLTDKEREEVTATLNSPEFCDLSPKQVVPILADRGVYLASESTMYRLLRSQGLVRHRAAASAPKRHRPRELVATAPNQVWSWDITYLHSPIRGRFFYLYLAVDVFSRKIVAAEVHDAEAAETAAAFLDAACAREGVQDGQLAIHSDNGAPMKGATLLATLQRLGVATSFSRPAVSNDNPFSEALFRTMKYRPNYPTRPFDSLDHARLWVADFVSWHDTAHHHCNISFVTPEQRHSGLDHQILAQRREVYIRAHAASPQRWSRHRRRWARVDAVRLNPAHASSVPLVA